MTYKTHMAGGLLISTAAFYFIKQNIRPILTQIMIGAPLIITSFQIHFFTRFCPLSFVLFFFACNTKKAIKNPVIQPIKLSVEYWNNGIKKAP